METIHKNTEWSGASQLLDSGEYSDLTLNCEDAKFRVHKAIVCAKSTVLASACGHGLQVCPLLMGEHLKYCANVDRAKRKTFYMSRISNREP